MKPHYCLATVTSETFVTGTEVLLYSFLKCNPWFDGDIVIIIDTLSKQAKARLSDLYPVIFKTRGAVVEQKIVLLRQKVPELRADLHLRLLSLEVFLLSGYHKVVFLDSDGLCTGNLLEMFEHPSQLAAANDGFGYEDLIDPMLEKLGKKTISTKDRYGKKILENTFNSGSMAIAAELLSEKTYLAVTELLGDFQIWNDFGVKGFTDQMLLNIHFSQQTTRLDGRYNFMPYMESYIKCVDGISLIDAKFVHFAGRIKPWFKFDWQQLLVYAPQYIKYLQLWLDVWQELRSKDKPELLAEKIQSQFDWMEGGNDAKITQLGVYE
ncbi:MAG: hypothetical protein JKY19_07240 [Alcanivoracaceae bacterium]|nr:hypothetical protein [Alcanivoracaceae bacterium]